MVLYSEIEKQLRTVGFIPKIWTRPEVRELQHILMPDETIIAATSGRHTAGFALLVATDKRLLLIDKKLVSLTVEDIRYEMVAEVDFFAHMFQASISVITISKNLKFTSARQGNMRTLTTFVQEQVMLLRQYQNYQQPSATPMLEHPSGEYLVPGASQLIAPRIPRPVGSAYPSPGLTVRRRISRFYPTA